MQEGIGGRDISGRYDRSVSWVVAHAGTQAIGVDESSPRDCKTIGLSHDGSQGEDGENAAVVGDSKMGKW